MSSKTYLKASVKFLDPSLDGANLAEVARFYRPLLKVSGDEMTSCFFEKIGDGVGVMKLDTFYEVLISLHMRTYIEQAIGRSIWEAFPVGRELEIVTIHRTVAVGAVEGIIEIGGADE